MSEQKPTIDWESVCREYRSGQMSLRAIGKVYGITEGAIRQRAKKENWSRDLSSRVREATRAKLADVISGNREEEERTIEMAATRAADIVREHQVHIRKGRGFVEQFFNELQESTDKRDEIAEEIEIETASDKNPKRRAAMLRAVALQGRANTLLSLSASLKNLVALERQAFNIDDKSDGGTQSLESMILASYGEKNAE